MTVEELRQALRQAGRRYPPEPTGAPPPPWPMFVRLPDGTVCEIVAVRPGPLEVVLDAEPKGAP